MLKKRDVAQKLTLVSPSGEPSPFAFRDLAEIELVCVPKKTNEHSYLTSCSLSCRDREDSMIPIMYALPMLESLSLALVS